MAPKKPSRRERQKQREKRKLAEAAAREAIPGRELYYQQLQELLAEPLIVEFDAALETDEFSFEEVYLFIESSPDFHEWRARMLQVSHDLFNEHFLPKFESVRGRLRECPPLIYAELWHNMISILSAELLTLPSGVLSRAQMLDFVCLMFHHSFFKLLKEALEEPGEAMSRFHAFQAISLIKVRTEGSNTPFVSRYVEIVSQTCLLAVQFYMFSLGALREALLSDDSLDEDQVSFGELQDLAEMHRFNGFTRVLGPFIVAFHGDEQSIAAMRRPYQITSIRVTPLAGGPFLDLVVDRHTGELTFNMTQIGFQDLFLEEVGGLERFKRFVYNNLHEHLIDHGVPIEFGPSEAAEVQEAVVDQVADVIEEAVSPVAVSQLNDFQLVGRLCGTSGGQLLRAFTRLLGPVNRVAGSHHIFKSPITGRNVIIPHHGSRGLGKGLMVKILKTAGLTPGEVVDAL